MNILLFSALFFAIILLILLILRYVSKLPFNDSQRRTVFIIFGIMIVSVLYVFYRYAVFKQSQELAAIAGETQACDDWRKNINNLRALCQVYEENSLFKEKGTVAFPAYSMKKTECLHQTQQLRSRFEEHSKLNLSISSFYSDAIKQEEKGINPDEKQLNIWQAALKKILPDNTREKANARKFLYECYAGILEDEN